MGLWLRVRAQLRPLLLLLTLLHRREQPGMWKIRFQERPPREGSR